MSCGFRMLQPLANKLLLLLVSVWSFTRPVVAVAAEEVDCTEVDNSGEGKPGRGVVTVFALVKTEKDEPAPGVLVELEDRGGSPDDRFGLTSSEGCVKFLEATGPRPCNRQTVKTPDYPEVQPRDLGCNHDAEHWVNLVIPDAGKSTGGECTMEDNSGGSARGKGIVNVTVLVKTEDGSPVTNALVELEDRGGSPDDRVAQTSPEGCVRFLESTGPRPCNRQTIKTPDYPDVQPRDLGCNHNAEFFEEFIVPKAATGGGGGGGEGGGGEDERERKCTREDNSGGGGTVKATVVVKTEDGSPAPGVLVELEDRGGTPDDRFARTSSEGCVLFLENTGPRPCNAQTVKLPDYHQQRFLGCNHAAELYKEFTVSEVIGPGPGPEVLGPAIGVPVGVVVLALIVVMILAVRRRRSRHGRRVSDPEHLGPVSRESSDNYSTTFYEFFGPHSLTPAAHPPLTHPQTIPDPPPSTPPRMPSWSIFNPVYGWLSKFSASFAEGNGVPPETQAVPQVANPSLRAKPGHAERPSAPSVNEPPVQPRGDPQPQGECLICLDGEPKYGFLHSGTLHLGVCENCLPSVQRQRVRECMVCRARVEQIIRVH